MDFKKYKFSVAALIVLFFVYDTYRWIRLATSNNFENSKFQYLEFYPRFVDNARVLTGIQIVLLAIASFLLSKFLNNKNTNFKIVSIIFFTLGVIMLLWRIFSLM